MRVMRARVFVPGFLLSVAIVLCLCGIAAALAPYSLAPSIAGMSSFGFPVFGTQGRLSSMAASPEALLGFASSLFPAGDADLYGFTPSASDMFPGSPTLSGLGSFMSTAPQSSWGSSFSYPDFLMPTLADQQSLAGFNPASIPTSADNYTEDSNGDTITIKNGDIIHVQLPARLDQGYLWNLSVTDGLNVTSTRMYPPSQVIPISSSGQIDIESIQEWDVQAIKPGTQYITARYKRSGTGGPVEKTYSLTVIVV